MADERNNVLFHIQVCQGNVPMRAAEGSVHTVVSKPRESARGAHAAPRTQRASSPEPHANEHRVEHEWSVDFYRKRYDVHDRGAAGMKIAVDGAVVWTGRRMSTGVYETHSSVLPTDKLERLLHRVGMAEALIPHAHVDVTPSHHPRSAPASAKASAGTVSQPASGVPRSGVTTPSKRPITERQAENLAQGRAQRAANVASRREGAAPAPAAPPKPKRGRRPRAQPKPNAPAAVAAPVAAVPASAGRVSRRAAAPNASDAAPKTHRSKRPEALLIDDERVLVELEQKLRKDLPARAEEVFPRMRALWLAGGREATIAWKQTHEIKSIVDAFSDWMEHNPDAAKAILTRVDQEQKAEGQDVGQGEGKRRRGRPRKAA